MKRLGIKLSDPQQLRRQLSVCHLFALFDLFVFFDLLDLLDLVDLRNPLTHPINTFAQCLN